jgi:hypothetical protein
MSNKLVVSDYDFEAIKSNLKGFLQGQTEFQDYDFEGSSLNILLDVLSYNTHYMAYLANMATNEIYLDSADIRNNIVSLAKMIGYTPSSPKAPQANIDIIINNASGTSITMAKGTVFTTSVDGTSYQYITNSDFTTTPVAGVYKFSSVPILEGTLVQFKYTFDSTDSDQKFILPSNKVDTSTLQVRVQNSSDDTSIETYALAGGYNNVTTNTKVYFLQEGRDGRYEIYFGDGTNGKSLEDGNIIILDYIVTNKGISNGASSFQLQGTIGGFSDVTISTVSASQGGVAGETNDSIKLNAPLQYAAQDRAVTTTDYESLVKSIYPNALSVSAWGGEDDETPRYGIVKIGVKAASGSTLTETTKADIVNKLKPYNVASVVPQIVDPEITSVLLTSTVKYNTSGTTKSSDTLKSEIITSLTNYNTNTLQKFDSIYRHSKVTGLIDGTDNSILSNITTVKIRKSFTPTIAASNKYAIYFRNALFNPHAGHNMAAGGILSSTGFKVTGSDNEMFFDDDGNGNVRRYFLSSGIRTYVNDSQGTINYSNGEIILNSLNVASISNIRGVTSTLIEITITPLSNDIVPVRDQIVEIDIANSNITVTADTFVGGSADAGVGYTTTSSY